jgi:hypothetical protein
LLLLRPLLKDLFLAFSRSMQFLSPDTHMDNSSTTALPVCRYSSLNLPICQIPVLATRINEATRRYH